MSVILNHPGNYFDAKLGDHYYNKKMRNHSFVKYSGNGNDFIIFQGELEFTKEQIIKLCDRHFGVGADGVIFVCPATKKNADARMRIFNAADGVEAEMCGNGLRCMVTFFNEISSHKKDTYIIETMNGLYPTFIMNGQVSLEMTEVRDINLMDLSIFHSQTNPDFSINLKSFYVNTGVPHLVFLVEAVNAIDVTRLGRFYRHHPLFRSGTNTTFVQKLDSNKQSAHARTYERGVEQETFSCGTGLTATALALSQWFSWKNKIHLVTRGGDQYVSLNEKIFYSGSVTHSFNGEVSL